MTLAVTVILGAGLVARSQLHLESLELGLAGDRILMVQVVPPQQDDYANPRQFNANLDRVIEAIAPLPGVQGVAPVLSEPFGSMSDGWDARYLLEGQAPEEQTRQPLLNVAIASPAFFRTLGIEIVRGRAFTDEDSAEGRPVLIVNASAARLAWPGKDAVGERMKISGNPWATVTGVAADTRYRELTAIRPTVYLPRAQFEAAPLFLAVRTAGDPLALAPAIRSAGQAEWPGVTFTSLRRLDDYTSEPLARSRVTAALFVGFAAICLLLSTIGLYGVVTAHVAKRTREVGIRMALGAPRRVVLRAVLLEGATMTFIGVVGGAAIAALFSGWLESILYGVSRHDPATIAAVALLVCLVTGVATYIPARRAASVEPTEALRARRRDAASSRASQQETLSRISPAPRRKPSEVRGADHPNGDREACVPCGAGQPWKPRAADHHAGQQCRAGFIERAHEPQAVRAASLDRGPIRRVNPAALPRRRRFPAIGVVTLRARRQSANPMT